MGTYFNWGLLIMAYENEYPFADMYTDEYIADENIPFVGAMWERAKTNYARMTHGTDPALGLLDRYTIDEHFAHIFRTK